MNPGAPASAGVGHRHHQAALVNGHYCHFNGGVWMTPDPELAALLHEETESSPNTHCAIHSLTDMSFTKPAWNLPPKS